MEQRIYVEDNYVLEFLHDSIRIIHALKEQLDQESCYYGYLSFTEPDTNAWCSACKKSNKNPYLVYRVFKDDNKRKFAQLTGFVCPDCGHICEQVLQLSPWKHSMKRITKATPFADSSRMELKVDYDQVEYRNSIKVQTRVAVFQWFQNGTATITEIGRKSVVRRMDSFMLPLEETQYRWEQYQLREPLMDLWEQAYKNGYGSIRLPVCIWEMTVFNKYRNLSPSEARMHVCALAKRMCRKKAEELLASATRSNFMLVGKALGLPHSIIKTVIGPHNLQILHTAEMYNVFCVEQKVLSIEQFALLCQDSAIRNYLFLEHRSSIVLKTEFILLIKLMGEFYSKASSKGTTLAVTKIAKAVSNERSFRAEVFTAFLRNLLRIYEHYPEAVRNLNFTDMTTVMADTKALLDALVADHEGYIYPSRLTKITDDFVLPKNDVELQLVAAKLQNCLGGYHQQIRDGEVAVLILGSIDNPIGAIEVRIHSKTFLLTQARGKANSCLSAAQIHSVREWANRHQVQIADRTF